MVEIQDNGMGKSEENQRTLFQDYANKSDVALAEKGLWISKSFVELHDGIIHFMYYSVIFIICIIRVAIFRRYFFNFHAVLSK